MVFAYKLEQYVPCYEPLCGYFGKDVNPVTGKRPIVFNLNRAFSGVRVKLPCGQCVGCRLERGRQWAVRIVQEMRMHTESAFLTLTYSEENLPKGSSLVKRDLQLFMKRLRKCRDTGLRFFACGEYGELSSRPHYHVLLLNSSFPDRVFWKESATGHPLYVSAELCRLWTCGDHYIGDVTFGSASYVAGYCVKKIKSEVLGNRIPEFICMSRNPGIGYNWLMEYGADSWKHDRCVIDGREVPFPRYYDDKFRAFGFALDAVKVKRRRSVVRSEQTPERRRVRARVAQVHVDRYKREM